MLQAEVVLVGFVVLSAVVVIGVEVMIGPLIVAFPIPNEVLTVGDVITEISASVLVGPTPPGRPVEEFPVDTIVVPEITEVSEAISVLERVKELEPVPGIPVVMLPAPLPTELLMEKPLDKLLECPDGLPG